MKRYNSTKINEKVPEDTIDLLWNYCNKLNVISGEIIIYNLLINKEKQIQKVKYFSTINKLNEGEFYIKVPKLIEADILILNNLDNKIMIMYDEY